MRDRIERRDDMGNGKLRLSMANAKPLTFVAAPGEFEEDGA